MKVMDKFTIHPCRRMKPVDSSGKPKTLDEVYTRYSKYKENAYRYCRELYNKVNGDNFHISGYNSQTFSVKFNFINPENGRPMVAHITRGYNHAYYSD